MAKTIAGAYKEAIGFKETGHPIADAIDLKDLTRWEKENEDWIKENFPEEYTDQKERERMLSRMTAQARLSHLPGVRVPLGGDTVIRRILSDDPKTAKEQVDDLMNSNDPHMSAAAKSYNENHLQPYLALPESERPAQLPQVEAPIYPQTILKEKLKEAGIDSAEALLHSLIKGEDQELAHVAEKYYTQQFQPWQTERAARTDELSLDI